MPGEPRTTTNHDLIRRWAEERGGKPTVVKGTQSRGEGAGMLRINFPGYGRRSSLEEISWEDFFKTFDHKKLTFLYQDKTKEGKESRFFKFIRREDKKEGKD